MGFPEGAEGIPKGAEEVKGEPGGGGGTTTVLDDPLPLAGIKGRLAASGLAAGKRGWLATGRLFAGTVSSRWAWTTPEGAESETGAGGGIWAATG